MTPTPEADVVAKENFWDGINHTYIPPADAQFPSSLKFHEESEVVTDPITFEVIRHNLWNINQEHALTIENLGVSPITVESRDFQTAICTERGEILFFGLGVQYFAGWMDYVIHYIMEHHGDDIADGDMWMCNDPWIGTAHQPDVNLLCPVFVDGKLYCWVANAAHMSDVGGTTPGSFCPNAEDIFWDPPLFPPCRLVRDGKLDGELERIYLRQSRTPVNLALDLRATVAGNHSARERMLSLVDKYGPATVKGVMNGLLDSTQESFQQMLSTIPDGCWRERLFQEVSVSGDRGVYKVELQLRKEGDVLTFTNEGTDPAIGAINLPFAAWRGGVMAVLNQVALADNMGVVGGAARQLKFDPTPGTLTCPDYGVAVSPSGIYSTIFGVSMANSVVSKMLACAEGPELREKALTPPSAQWPIHIHSGTNQRGDYYVGPMLDSMVGMSGAMPFMDGQFAAGCFFAPAGRAPNVESYERDWPMLYLYRRRDEDSGGAGRSRGGVGGRLAYVPYNGEMTLGVYSAEGVPKTVGLMGGSPGSTGQSKLQRGSRVYSAFSAGELPVSLADVGGDPVQVYGKGDPVPVEADDVLEWNWSGSGGYGDPLTRDPAAVVADLKDGLISERGALEEYAVILEDGEVDVEATKRARKERRRGRLSSAGHTTEVPDELGVEFPEGALHVGSDIWFDRTGGTYHCAHCGQVTGEQQTHAMAQLVRHEAEISDISPLFEDPAIYVDQEMAWREYFCPGCGVRHSTEVARPTDEPLADIELSA